MVCPMGKIAGDPDSKLSYLFNPIALPGWANKMLALVKIALSDL